MNTQNLPDETPQVGTVASSHTDNPNGAVEREPIAIVGVGCRFPGNVHSPASFWQLLREGRDATTQVPADRWDLRTFYDPDPRKPGKVMTQNGGFMTQVDQFDAPFFGISPREADHLDPQQRLLLEVAWEAFEDAGIIPAHLAGTNVGVFVGGFTLDYQVLRFKDHELVGTHTAVGSMMTILSARLSYIFDLRGPCLSVDTACSSSLVAVHLACQSLWNQECTMALAGGVNVMTTPEYVIAESKGGFLSPDGHSKAFDASANGYARGEGAGIIVLKPVSRALADGDPIYAVIRGTGINQDGHTNGITVPRREAQEALLREVYRRAGIAPGQVQYVEAHGTGTPVGDPLEASALASVFATDRPAGNKCIIGSCKTNIGHLEAGAGIAGLIKVALSLKNRQIPPHLHFRNPNPQIPFDELCIRIPTTLEDWPEVDGPHLAGVNSFGFGGTNAHVVLEAAPSIAQATTAVASCATAETGSVQVLPLSARHPDALRAMARSYQELLASESDNAAAPLRDLLYTASVRRSHHEYRLALVADSKEQFREQLAAFLADESRPGIVSGRKAAGQSPRLVFVFTGMGPQWWAMGRELMQQEPLFRETVETCDRLFQQHAGWSLLKEWLADEAASRMEETEIAQPANVMLQIGLTALWRAWGIVPDIIVGHSVGEIAAAHIAGILSLEDTMLVAYHRSRLQQKTSGMGTMMAVGLPAEQAEQLLIGYEDRVSIGAINSPSAVTLSGEREALEELAQQLQAKQIFNRFLQVKIPYHSCKLDPLQDELLASLQPLNPQPPTTRIYSTVTGQAVAERAYDAPYWWLNVRQPVRFATAADNLIQEGYTLFLEVGPHPVLATSISECLTLRGREGSVLPTLRRKEAERFTMLSTLGALYSLGYAVDWRTLYPTGRPVQLPTYPWQRERYWAESEEWQQIRLGTATKHPLLGRRLKSPHPAWEGEVNLHYLAYLRDHAVQGAVLYPGAAYIEMGLAAAKEAYNTENCTLENIEFRRALFLMDGDSPKVQLHLNPHTASFDIYSRPLGANQAWTINAGGRLRQLPDPGIVKQTSLNTLMAECSEELSGAECYRQLQEKGFQYGPCFQGIGRLWRGVYDAVAELRIPPEVEADLHTYQLHPAILDACFQLLLAIEAPDSEAVLKRAGMFLPVGIDRIQVYGRVRPPLWSHAHIVAQNERAITGDIRLFDADGTLLVNIQGFRANSLESTQSASAAQLDDWLYEMEWQPQARATAEQATESKAEQPGSWIIFADRGGAGRALAEQLRARGHTPILVVPGEAYAHTDDGLFYKIRPAYQEDLELLFATVTACSRLPCHGIVHLWALHTTSPDDTTLDSLHTAETEGVLTVMAMAQVLARIDLPARLWLVTRGAQPVAAEPALLEVAQAPLWGLGRIIGHQEHVKSWGGAIDLDPATPIDDVGLLLEELLDPDNEDQIAFREGQRYVVRLVHSRGRALALPPQLRTDASYLITGGLGVLGVLVAKWMIAQGARHLILMGRTPLPPRREWSQISAADPTFERIAAIRELEALGATIHVAPVDVADEAALSDFLRRYEAEGWPSIRGVIHSAGLVRDQLLSEMSVETFTTVLKPKIAGAWALHRALQHTPLDFFILFSSLSSLIAQTGQGNYAAANAFLDALTYTRRAQGLPALSINWGPWDAGMIRDLNLVEHYARRGMESISAGAGIELLGRLFGYDRPQVAVVCANWPLVLEYYPRIPQQVAHLGIQQQAADGAGAAESEENFIQRLLRTDAPERQALVEEQLLDLLAKVLRMDRSRLEPETVLNALGMDSLMATELRNRIDLKLGVSFAVVELLQGLTIVQLVTRAMEQLHARLDDEARMAELFQGDTPISAEAVEELADRADEATVADLLQELEHLSEEEVEALLAHERV